MSTRRGRAAPRRAVVRWAWRLFRREWRQQVLVLGLLVLAVSAAVGGSTMAVNAATEGKGRFGTAGGLIDVDATDSAAAANSVAVAQARFGALEVVGHQSVAVPGSNEQLDLRMQAPNGKFSAPTLALRDGRYPSASGEIALTSDVAGLLGVRIGSQVDLGRVTRTVVGAVENPGDLNDSFGLLATAEQPSATSLTLFIRSTQARIARSGSGGGTVLAQPVSFRIEGAPRDEGAVAVSVIVMATFTMALVALIAAAGFLVVAQRRQRQLGLFAAIGATERQVRLVTVANGVIVGLAAAVVGTVVGVLGWVAMSPAVETAIGHRVDRWDLPWTLILWCLGLAVLASTAAAWWPARLMARQPIMSALSRRPTRPSPVHRSLTLAAVMLGVGAAAIIKAHPTGATVRPLYLLGGLLLMIVGVVLVAPGALRVIAAPAARLPFALRLALRDLSRYQARAASAIAAITLGLAASVTVVVLAQANQYKADEGNLSSRQMIVQLAESRDPGATPPELVAEEQAVRDDDARRVAAAVPGSSITALDVALNPTGSAAVKGEGPIQVVTPIEHGFRGVGVAYVATPELLAQLGIDASTIDPSTELITSLAQPNVGLLDFTLRPGRRLTTVVQRMPQLGFFTSAPKTLITASAMAAHGWSAVRSGWLVQSDDALTSDEIANAREVAADAGLAIEIRSGQDDLAALRTGATVVGVLLALAIVAMTIGLLRGEAVADLRTLTATGASGTVRRALTASTAGALALAGTLLSTAGSYGALVAGYHADLDKLVPVPWANLSVLIIGLPVLAAAAGWLLAGKEPRTFARQLAE